MMMIQQALPNALPNMTQVAMEVTQHQQTDLVQLVTDVHHLSEAAELNAMNQMDQIFVNALQNFKEGNPCRLSP